MGGRVEAPCNRADPGSSDTPVRMGQTMLGLLDVECCDRGALGSVSQDWDKNANNVWTLLKIGNNVPNMTDALRNAVLRLLRPLVRVLLRAGVSHAEFADLARQVFVEVADADFRLPGRKQTVARIAMLTGIQRKEVSRLRSLPERGDDERSAAYNRGVRVIAGWRNDERFSGPEGPAALSAEAFAELVRAYSGDLPARAVRDELLRVGAIREARDGELELGSPAGYVPTDLDAAYNIMGGASRDLFETFAHNFDAGRQETRLQLTTAYDNLPRRAVERFRHVSHEDCVALLGKFDAWLAAHDRDATAPVAQPEDGRYRAGIGVYYFEEQIEAEVEA